MNQSRTKTILLVFGGESSEHDVSLASAKNIHNAMNPSDFSVICCYIDHQGRWWHVDTVAINNRNSPQIECVLGESAIRIGSQQHHIDVLFPVLHGQNGEDGTIQGLARMAHIPIVGCDIDGSVICIDKVITKKLLEQAGLPVAPYRVYHANKSQPTYADMQSQLGGTAFFIKPARQGSSVGISKADSPESFAKALETAFHHDTKLIIEPAMNIREIEVAVKGPTMKPGVSIPGEIIPDRDFYDYQSKYAADSTSAVQIPANLDEQVAKQIQEYAGRAYETLLCRGLARIDFFISPANDIYINEVNTLPGFTNISMYPKLWEASGVPYQTLITELTNLALHDT